MRDQHQYRCSSAPEGKADILVSEQENKFPDQPAVAPQPSSSADPPAGGKLPLAIGAVAAGVLLFGGMRLSAAGPSLASIQDMSIPIDVALANGKPTVLEFYAKYVCAISQIPCQDCYLRIPVKYPNLLLPAFAL